MSKYHLLHSKSLCRNVEELSMSASRHVALEPRARCLPSTPATHPGERCAEAPLPTRLWQHCQ
eukprot:3180783-Prymnesium_polylepis.1